MDGSRRSLCRHIGGLRRERGCAKEKMGVVRLVLIVYTPHRIN